MKELDEIERVLGTVCELLVADDASEAADLVRKAPAKVDATGYDNWNGGTTQWTVMFGVEATEYAKLGGRREQLAEQITTALKAVTSQFTDDWYSVTIAPRISVNPDWRQGSKEISVGTRINIIDGIEIDGAVWCGRLDEVQFLERIFELGSIPSNDVRFKNAAGDIWQHCINNDDWDRNWIFRDERFNLVNGPASTFLRFLCEMVHPVVRPDRDEALKLVKHFNDQLRPESWELCEEERIAGRARYIYRSLRDAGVRSVSRAKTVADALDAAWMQKEIERLEHSIEKDPALAIGTAKDLVETCCKSILSKRGVEFSRKATLIDLTTLLTKELQLVPDGISDEAKGAENIRLILRNLTSLTNNLAQLRGLYGSGHGRDGKHRGLESRHARLAVGSAVTFIDFITETYHCREGQGVG